MSDAITDTIVRFLGSIGLEVRGGPVADGTPLPGITVSEGAIVVDHEKLLYPGDLLHEAGHDVTGVDISQAMLDKIERNETRYPVAKARGSNAKYNEL